MVAFVVCQSKKYGEICVSLPIFCTLSFLTPIIFLDFLIQVFFFIKELDFLVDSEITNLNLQGLFFIFLKSNDIQKYNH